MHVLKHPKILLFFICIFLAIIPFFWMKPGEMDLGGDSSRLYFYDPSSYLQNFSLYTIFPEGTGRVDPNYYFLPFMVFLVFLKTIFRSSYTIIVFFNGLKLVGGFISVYFILKELLSFKKEIILQNKWFVEIISILTGLFYIFMPTMILNYDKALMSHNQIFLNPLMFYLLLKFFLYNDQRFLWLFLIISSIFAPNFALTSAPPFFAFYPLGILFIVLYVVLIRKHTLPIKNIILGIILFFLLQSFQLVPQIQSLFDPGSFSNTRVFDRQSIYQEGVRYFNAVLPLAKATVNIFLPTPLSQAPWILFFVPLTIILGFIFNKRNKSFLLTAIFFFITFFLLTGHITDTGVLLYQQLFYVPGFSMFRNFIGQWMFVYSFFYALLFGQALVIIFEKMKKPIFLLPFLAVIFIPLIISAFPFINGSLVNRDWYPNNKRHIAITIDPNYEKTLSFIQKIPDDSKLLTLPMTDPYYQLLSGKNNGLYIGPSTISYLTGKKDFDGYQIIEPYSEVLLRLAREKNYQGIERMLGMLNIHYIFYNSDPSIYDAKYIGFPYQYVRQSLPTSQKEYKTFIERDLGAKKIYQKGLYSIYSLDQSYLPHIYTTTSIACYKENKNDWFGKNLSFFENETNIDPRLTYLSTTQCTQLQEKLINKTTSPTLIFQRINPTKYLITVQNATNPYVLSFLEAFHGKWKLFPIPDMQESKQIIGQYFNKNVQEQKHTNIFFDTSIFKTFTGMPLTDSSHILIDGYANGWYITPADVRYRKNYLFVLEMTSQRIFYICLFISLVTFVCCLLWGAYLLFKFVKSTAIMRK